MTTDQVASAESTRVPPRRVRPLAIVAVVALAVDVVSKMIAVATLEGNPPVRLFGGFIYLRLIRNPGAAFSFGTGLTWVFSLVMIAVSAAIIWLAFRLRHTGWAIGLGFVLAGALGNLTDRLFRGPGPFRGHVVDFISLFSPNGHPWPIFNIADACINVGGAIVVIMALRGINYDGSTNASRRDAAARKVAGPEHGAHPVRPEHPAHSEHPVAERPAAAQRQDVQRQDVQRQDVRRPVEKPAEKSRAEQAADKVRALAQARASAPTMRVAPVQPPVDEAAAKQAGDVPPVHPAHDEEHLSGDLPTDDAAKNAGTEPPTARIPAADEATAVMRPVGSPESPDAVVDEPTAQIDLNAAKNSEPVSKPEPEIPEITDESTSDPSTVDAPEKLSGEIPPAEPVRQVHIEQTPVEQFPVLSGDATAEVPTGKIPAAAPPAEDATSRIPAAEPETAADAEANPETVGSVVPESVAPEAEPQTEAVPMVVRKLDDPELDEDTESAAKSDKDEDDEALAVTADSDSAELCGVDDEATTQLPLGATPPEAKPSPAKGRGAT